LILILLLIVGCTPQKRLANLVSKYPYLIQDNDTTIYYQTSSVDTSFVFNKTSNSDTFYIQETQTKVYRYYDTIRVEQDGIKDSIIINTHTIEIKEIPKKLKLERNIFNKLVIILTFIVVIMSLYLFRNVLYPMALKSAIGSGLLGYVLTKRFVPNSDVAILGSLASAYLGYNFTKGRDLTNEQKHSINEEIQARKKRLRSLGVEIKADETGVLSAEEIENMDYAKYIFGNDKYGNFMGDPAVGFHAIVFGLPKGGKSIWSMQFADYLANHFGNVLYIASEEGFKGTIKDKIVEWTTNRQNLKFGNFTGYEEIKENIDGYDFVFIDSLDFAKISVEEMEELKAENPNTSFVTIKQVTKDGKFRGSQEYAHNCDIIIEIIDGVANQKGRYNPEAQMLVFEKEEIEE